MGIVAAFDKVLFFNAASKYSVLRLKTADIMIPQEARSPFTYRDHLIRFVAVGYDLPQTDAVNFEYDGTWTKGTHGCQLQVERWSEIIPPTLEGIRGYLASGLLKGIGEKTADAIVLRFGLKSLDVIENHPEKLLEIRGITEDRLEDIKNGYAESKVMRDLMTILAPFKVTPATAMKIYQHFGPGGVSLIRQSPYRLCQIPGFGFRRVDAIVQKSGGNLHDPMRVQGALFYALERSRSEGGHLYVEAENLIRSTLLLLNEKIPPTEGRLSQQQIEKELSNMILSDVVVSNKGNIYLPHVFKQESETACKVVKMLLEEPEPVDLTPVLERVKGQLGIVLSQRQSEGVEMAFRHNLSIITGGPGTGKSTILKAVIEAYRSLYPRKNIMLGAPTGKASRRMAETTGLATAQTLHSLLGLHGEDAGWQKKKPLEADLLIVDESSMMDMWLAYPQSYAAALTMFQTLSTIPKALVLDIGGMTADYLQIKYGEGDLSVCDSLENGVIRLYNRIESKVRAEQDILLTEREIDAILLGTEVQVPFGVATVVDRLAQEFIADLLSALRERQLELKSGPVIFVGGGSILLRKQIQKSGKVSNPLFVEDIRANARGYEVLYKLSQNGR